MGSDNPEEVEEGEDEEDEEEDEEDEEEDEEDEEEDEEDVLTEEDQEQYLKLMTESRSVRVDISLGCQYSGYFHFNIISVKFYPYRLSVWGGGGGGQI